MNGERIKNVNLFVLAFTTEHFTNRCFRNYVYVYNLVNNFSRDFRVILTPVPNIFSYNTSPTWHL